MWISRREHYFSTYAHSNGMRMNEQYSEEVEVGVGVHKGFVHSSLLFILVLESGLQCTSVSNLYSTEKLHFYIGLISRQQYLSYFATPS